MKRIVFLVFMAIALLYNRPSMAQAKIEVKTEIKAINSKFRGEVILQIKEGQAPYTVTLFKMTPKPLIFKEIKNSYKTVLTFDNLEDDFYFIHVKDASGKLAISNAIKIDTNRHSEGGTESK